MSFELSKKQTANPATTDESLRHELEQCRKRISELAQVESMESMPAGENQILESVAQGIGLHDWDKIRTDWATFHSPPTVIVYDVANS